MPSIPTPSDQEIQRICEIYASDQSTLNEAAAIRLVLKVAPGHDDPVFTLLKVSTINQIYRTVIFDIHTVADTIQNNAEKLISLLASGDGSAVNLIRLITFKDKQRDNYSFATKYCHIHNIEQFPIFDSRVERSLYWIHSQRKFCDPNHLSKLREYEVFKSVLQSLRNHFSLTCTVPDLDRFLWHFGKKPT